jgi:hypothetical protein
MRVLHLTLKKKWFDLIASGEKKEEYREIKKHWVSRFCDLHDGAMGGDLMDRHSVKSFTLKEWDFVIFRNGYSGGASLMSVKCEGVEIGYGKPEWGAEEGKEYFVIKLGEITRDSSRGDDKQKL